MAKPGAREGGSARGERTREAFLEAARATLIEEGFARTSARSIAERAGVSQASVFYHFESVPDLLLAVLDAVSTRRKDAFAAAIESARTPRELLAVGRRILAGDAASGDTRVLVEIIAGSHSVAGMPAKVAERLAPWEELAADVVRRTIPRPLRSRVNARTAGHGLAALVLGLELLGSLRGPHDAPPDVLAGLSELAGEGDR